MSTMIPRGNVRGIYTCSLSFDAASVAANTTAEQDVTVPGVMATDICIDLTKPSLSAGLGIVNVRVKAANTISITYVNATASPIDPAAETYTFTILRLDSTASTINL